MSILLITNEFMHLCICLLVKVYFFMNQLLMQVFCCYMGVYSFNQYLMSIYYLPSTVLNTEDITVNKSDKNICPCRPYILLLKLFKYDIFKYQLLYSNYLFQVSGLYLILWYLLIHRSFQY